MLSNMLRMMITELHIKLHNALSYFTDPCKSGPCGNLGVCIPDGNSYKCKCTDGKTVTSSCSLLTSSRVVMPFTAIVPIPSSSMSLRNSIIHSSASTTIITTSEKRFTTTASPAPSPSA